MRRKYLTVARIPIGLDITKPVWEVYYTLHQDSREPERKKRIIHLYNVEIPRLLGSRISFHTMDTHLFGTNDKDLAERFAALIREYGGTTISKLSTTIGVSLTNC